MADRIDGMAPLGPDKAAGVLGQWASLAAGAERLQQTDWGAMRSFIEATKPKIAENERQMSQLLDKSDMRLAPLVDPLRTDFTLHRWLKGDREEAYSDWLAWTLQQVGSVGDVLNALGVPNVNAVTADPEATPKVTREEWVMPEGRPPARRLDLLVQQDGTVLAVIEVKVVSLKRADLEKNQYYWLWAQSRNRDAKAILLALDGNPDDCHPFALLTWARLCLNLRGLLHKIREEKGIVAAALTAAFIGAVEQNLLRFSIWSADSLVSEHIRASL